MRNLHEYHYYYGVCACFLCMCQETRDTQILMETMTKTDSKSRKIFEHLGMILMYSSPNTWVLSTGKENSMMNSIAH